MPFLSWLVDASILSQSIFRLLGGGGMIWSVEGAKIKHQSIDDFLGEQFFSSLSIFHLSSHAEDWDKDNSRIKPLAGYNVLKWHLRSWVCVCVCVV